MITDFIKTITSKERYKKIARHLAEAGYQVEFDGKKVVGRSDIKKLWVVGGNNPLMFVFHEYEILPGVNKEALDKAIQAANNDFNPGKIKEEDGTLIVSVPIVNTRIKDTLTSIEVADYLLNTLIDSVLQEYKKQDSLYSLAETSVTKLPS